MEREQIAACSSDPEGFNGGDAYADPQHEISKCWSQTQSSMISLSTRTHVQKHIMLL